MAEHEIDRAIRRMAQTSLSAIMLLITLAILVVGQFLVWRNARRSGQRGAQASVAGMIVEQSG